MEEIGGSTIDGSSEVLCYRREYRSAAEIGLESGAMSFVFVFAFKERQKPSMFEC